MVKGLVFKLIFGKKKKGRRKIFTKVNLNPSHNCALDSIYSPVQRNWFSDVTGCT